MSEALLRIVYASRAPEPGGAAGPTAEVRAILSAARAYNGAHGVTGLLIVANGYFLQVLEGERGEIESLFARIGRDRRHTDVSLLSSVEVVGRSFSDWSMGLVERAEPEDATAERLRVLRDRLANDPEVSAADFCRLILSPTVNPLPAMQPLTHLQRELISSVAFVSPTGMWGAAVIQHLASSAMLRTGRTTVIDPDDAAQRTLIEYIDFEASDHGRVRALSLAARTATFGSVAPLMERLSLLVFTLSPSDTDSFVAYVQAWLSMAQVVEAAPEVLVLAGLPQERVAPVLDALRARTPLSVGFSSVKLSDSKAVWQAVQAALSRRVSDRRATGRPRQAAFAGTKRTTVQLKKSQSAAQRGKRASASDAPAPAASAFDVLAPALEDTAIGAPTDVVASIEGTGCLLKLLGFEGAVGASLIDADRRLVLLTLGRSGTPSLPHDDEAQLLHSKWNLVKSLDIDAPIEDIAITTHRWLHVYRALPTQPALFLGFTLARSEAQLASARMHLQDVTEALVRPTI